VTDDLQIISFRLLRSGDMATYKLLSNDAETKHGWTVILSALVKQVQKNCLCIS
jgi:hypothetical protein